MTNTDNYKHKLSIMSNTELCYAFHVCGLSKKNYTMLYWLIAKTKLNLLPAQDWIIMQRKKLYYRYAILMAALSTWVRYSDYGK